MDCKICNGEKYINRLELFQCLDCNKDGLFIDMPITCKCKGTGAVRISIKRICYACKENKILAKL